MEAFSNTLSEMSLFRGLDSKQMAAVENGLQLKIVPANTALITVDEAGEFVYVLLEGTVKIYAGRKAGDCVTLFIAGPGELLGDLNAFDGLGHQATVVALEPCILLHMEGDFFMHCVRTMPTLSHNLTRLLIRRLRASTARIHLLATGDTKNRLARLLLSLVDQFACEGANGHLTIPLRLPQNDLADMIGASRQQVNKILTAFKRSKLVSVDANHRITVRCRATLIKHCAALLPFLLYKPFNL